MMNRRGFLGKLIPASGLAASAASAGVWTQVADDPVRVAGTGDGRLCRSGDGGATWQTALRLGDGRPVLRVEKDDGFRVEIGCAPARFWLRSADGWTWHVERA